jgi:hypothetical protein
VARQKNTRLREKTAPASSAPFDFATPIPSGIVKFADQVDEARAHEERFWLIPRYWGGYKYRRSLAWRTVRFAPHSARLLPQEPGVYVFSVQPPVSSPLPGAYVMYVGETRALRQRFRDYLAEARSLRARPKLLITLYRFRGHLFFSYATLPARERKRAEDALITALWPPRNDMFPATIRRVRKAFG